LCVFHEQTTHIHNCDTVSKSGNDKVLESLNLGYKLVKVYELFKKIKIQLSQNQC